VFSYEQAVVSVDEGPRLCTGEVFNYEQQLHSSMRVRACVLDKGSATSCSRIRP